MGCMVLLIGLTCICVGIMALFSGNIIFGLIFIGIPIAAGLVYMLINHLMGGGPFKFKK